MPALDRKYTPEELADIAAKGSIAMGDLPEVVILTAHLVAANAMMTELAKVGPLPPDFRMACEAMRAVTGLYMLVCKTGRVR